MRFLILNTDYQSFLDELYRRTPGLARASYDEQMRARNATFFGVGDAYVRALRSRGHDAHDVHMNNAPMQRAWAREHLAHSRPSRRTRSLRLRMRRGIVPWPNLAPDEGRLVEVLAAQVSYHQPEVVLNHDITWIEPDSLRNIVGPDCILVGQHAAPPYPMQDYGPYDLIVSSWPPTIDRMLASGVRAEHLALGFDPLLIERLGPTDRDLPLTFVGSFSSVHRARTSLIEELCRARPDMHVYAPSVDALPKASAIRACYRGSAYGLDMFRVLARSQVTINHHGFPEPHANNMRLFEATGVGSLLLTDHKPDLVRYFEPGSEVLTYASLAECVAVLDGLETDVSDEVRQRGRERTLRAHTWDRRIEALLSML